MYARHYAPRAVVKIVPEAPKAEAGLVFTDAAHEGQVRMPLDPAAYGSGLYRALRRLDQAGHEVIYVEAPPLTPAWDAVNDRLRKASGSS
ncbi:Sua5 family C-terminal domain-containing protein, partial [Acinetobacter baumannii]